jgi:hypothetical protein
MASVHDFFEGQVDRDLFYWHYHSGETRLSKKKLCLKELHFYT